MMVVDSSVWIDYFRAKETTTTRILHLMAIEETILVGDLILLEILQGTHDDLHAYRIETRLRRFQIKTMVNASLAVTAARSYRRLREKSITIRKTIDLLIGTFCIEHGHSLLHQDRDFDPMREHLGLKVISL